MLLTRGAVTNKGEDYENIYGMFFEVLEGKINPPRWGCSTSWSQRRSTLIDFAGMNRRVLSRWRPPPSSVPFLS